MAHQFIEKKRALLEASPAPARDGSLKQFKKDFAEFNVSRPTVRKLERFQWLPYNAEERFLRDWDKHSVPPPPTDFLPRRRFRIVGDKVVFYRGCYFSHAYPRSQVIVSVLPLYGTQIFPSL